LMHGVHLTEDQSHVLDQLAELIREARVDALVVSGDIYDRAVPPPDAVKVLDEFLARVVVDLNVPVILIAGNHDSPLRLEFGSRMFAGQGLHVAGSVGSDIGGILLGDKHGPVRFYALPYAEPANVREYFSEEAALDHDAALRMLVQRVRQAHPADERAVLLTHVFAAGGTETESERPLSVGGAGQVDSSCLHGFDYVALGHLHRPQTAGEAHIRYAGSLLKYSFSEADHRKSVTLVDMDETGRCFIETIPLSPLRDVRRIQGYLKDILKADAPDVCKDDYVMVTLLDTGAILDVMGKLRQVYSNVLHVERPRVESATTGMKRRVDHRSVNDGELFADFFSEVTGGDISPTEIAAYEAIVDDLLRRDREAVCS
jgi:exonuclease SbcD